jgi:tyrosine aminotransferase
MVIEADSGGGGARTLVQMAQADLSVFPCFRTTPEAVYTVAGTLQSREHNCYPTCVGLEPTRR